MNITAEEYFNMPEGAFHAHIDWLEGMSLGRIAEKYGYRDRLEARRIIREAQLALLIKPASDKVAITLNSKMLEGDK